MSLNVSAWTSLAGERCEDGSMRGVCSGISFSSSSSFSFFSECGNLQRKCQGLWAVGLSAPAGVEIEELKKLLSERKNQTSEENEKSFKSIRSQKGIPLGNSLPRLNRKTTSPAPSPPPPSYSLSFLMGSRNGRIQIKAVASQSIPTMPFLLRIRHPLNHRWLLRSAGGGIGSFPNWRGKYKRLCFYVRRRDPLLSWPGNSA